MCTEGAQPRTFSLNRKLIITGLTKMTRSKHKNKQRARHGSKQQRDDFESNSGHDSNQEKSLPYTIQQSSTIGRYLVAGRELEAGELILQEAPLAVGPVQDTQPICIGCYCSLNFEEAWRCDHCAFPLCSPDCSGKGQTTGHSTLECSTLARSLVKEISPPTKMQSSLEAITVLRCLVLREADPTAWTVLNGMEAHTEQRRKVTTLWESNQWNVVNVIRGQWGLNEFDEELIHHICGVLEVNAFEVGPSLRAVYPTAYLFAHSCVPNTRHSDDKEFNITFRTTRPIPKEGMLFVTYTYVLQGTLRRRKHLSDTKFFDCACDRCRDATEFGTNISALKCPQCGDGLVQSTQPLDPDAHWACTSAKCADFLVPASTVMRMTESIFNELDSIDGNDIPAYEEFLENHSNKLHENHHLCLSALHCLFQLYGKIDGYLINTLTDQQLQRKAQICRTLLEAFDKLDPGFSKQRGLILYELHAPLIILLQRSYQEKRGNKLEMKLGLREVFRCLEEAQKLLQVEPPGSQEAEMASAAGEALERLTTWRKIIQKM